MVRQRPLRRGLGLLLLFLTIAPVHSQSQPPPLRLLFFGDIMVERRLEPLIQEHGVSHLFQHISRLPDGTALTALDLVSANLEGPITPGGVHWPPVYPYDFAFPPERIAALRDQGISYLTIANNHLYDQGPEGVDATRHHLQELGIDHSGDLDRVVSDHSMVIVERQALQIALLAFSEVYNPLQRDEVRETVRQAASQADLVIVNMHWGVEYEHLPRQHQRDMATILVRAGADLVIGHHPHVVQGVELVEGRPVFYSLGNFLFDQAFSPEVQQGLAVEVTVNPAAPTATLEFSLHPYRAENFVPRWLTGEERTSRLEAVAAWSFGDEALVNEVRTGVLTPASMIP